jgi:hypothetical protein
LADTTRSGDIIINEKAPSWGRGKVVAVDGTKLHVVFEHEGGRAAKVVDLRFAAVRVLKDESVPLLDALPPMKKEGATHVFGRERVTVPTLVERFIRMFPGAFAGQRFREEERDYKDGARAEFDRLLGHGVAERLIADGDGAGIAKRIQEVVGKQNLMATQEVIALSDALKDSGAAVRFLSALTSYLAASEVTEATFASYLAAVEALPKVGALRVFTWPVATLLPFLAQPHRHMFLKPSVTKEAAEAMAFDLRYDSAPNWATYERLLLLSSELFKILEPMGARDMIDVQSFVWTTLA